MKLCKHHITRKPWPQLTIWDRLAYGFMGVALVSGVICVILIVKTYPWF